MGRAGAFLEIERREHGVRPAAESVTDYDEFVQPLSIDDQCEQASRCMNCGVAFCQSGIVLSEGRIATGCPLQNLIPETNDLLYRRRWDDAVGRLFLTNPFPELTGRVCPSPCEAACNLGLQGDAVAIHDNERALADYAWERGIDPLPQPDSSAPSVTVVGSGPAGLAVAWELCRQGVRVRIVERAGRPGGLLMYGIPNMKLSKDIVARRVRLMEESGIEFCCDVDACGQAAAILEKSDAVVLAGGASVARDLDVEGRRLMGVHFAVDYLSEVTAAFLDGRSSAIDAAGKDVVVIGGGDTGVDCVASALRQGAQSVTQVIRAPRPPAICEAREAWPGVRPVCSQGYGQREAQEVFGRDPRIWSTDTIGFVGENAVEGVRICDLSYDGGRHAVEGTERELSAQLVLIAKGFIGADPALFEAFGVKLCAGEIAGYRLEGSSDTPIFAAGDGRLGATLVATAIADGLCCAREVRSVLSSIQHGAD